MQTSHLREDLILVPSPCIIFIGFYSTTEELNAPVQAPNFDMIDINKMEPLKRYQLEDQQMKKDALKQKGENKRPFVPDLKKLEESNERDLEKRRRMMLPTPQVKENELDEVSLI